jgi:hypothetical protein
MAKRTWQPGTDDDAARALGVWPLDKHNAVLLDNVHPVKWDDSEPPGTYDLLVIGAGAGGLVSSKQAARRGVRSAMISEHLAGGDCLNVGCVPSKALLRCARAVREVRRAAEFGVTCGPPVVDFGAVMERMRRLRAEIAPADAHEGTAAAGADVFQGRGRFTGRNTVEVRGSPHTCACVNGVKTALRVRRLREDSLRVFVRRSTGARSPSARRWSRQAGAPRCRRSRDWRPRPT